MIEMRLKHEGGGRFSPASHVDWKVAEEELDKSEVLLARLVRQRSAKENNLFFGAIKSAWDNQRGGPLFREEDGGWEKLRAWLLCEAGWCDMHEFAPGSVSKDVVAVLKQRDQSAFWSVTADGIIRVRFPKSISYKSCKSDEFHPVKTKVFELLCGLICPGATPEELMEIRYSRPKVRRKGGALVDA